MFRVEKESNYTIEIEKSKFICYINRAFSEQEAKDYIDKIKKEHSNATHHCYAFLCKENNQIQRSNDNGEPSGSAGVPILECLKKNDMGDTVAVVVRYFGGIKLGVGGLISAYTKSVSETLAHSTRTKTTNSFLYELIFDYDFIGKLDYFLNQNNIEILEKEYEEKVAYSIRSEKDIQKDIEELSNGKYELKLIREEIIEKRVV